MHFSGKSNFLLFKKLTFCLLLGQGVPFTTTKLTAQTIVPKDQQFITLHLTNTNLDQVLLALEKQTSYIFSYDRNMAGRVSLSQVKYQKKTLNEVLSQLKNEANIIYDIDGRNISVRVTSAAAPARAVTSVKKDGVVAGTIIDEESLQPVVGATITIGGKTVVADADGAFTMNLANGNYDAEVSSVGYGKKIIGDVIVKDQQPFMLNLTMKREKGQLSGVVVRTSARREGITALYVRQKNAAAVSDGISAEQISRTPDNNIGQVLKRVSGLQTTDDNKFAVVRGLGERYNNVLLNGSQLPSSEPNRRNFAFDMVPSAMVDNVVVSKTATPDLPGEFSGGIIQITTKDIPLENFLQIDLAGGYNTMSTGKEFYGIQRGKYNYLGFMDKNVHGEPAYGKPDGMSFADYNAIAYKLKTNEATPVEKKRAEAFLGNLPDTWRTQRFKAQPMQAYGLTIGRVYNTGKQSKFGFAGGVNYRNDQTVNEYDLYQHAYKDYKGKEYIFTSSLGGSLNLGYSFGKHKIALLNTYNRRFTDKMYQFSGLDLNNSNYRVSGYSSQTLINALFQSRLQASHGIGNKGVKVEWSADAATMQRDQPFSRVMNSLTSGNVKDYYNYYFGNVGDIDYGNIFYSNLKEKRYSGQASILLPFHALNQNQQFKAGWLTSYRKADFGAELYRIMNTNQNLGNDYIGLPYYDVYNSRRFEDGELYLYPVAGGGEDGANGKGSGYSGSQRLNSYYGMLDMKLLPALRVIGGVRAEKYKQEVSTKVWQTDNTWIDQPITIDKTDWLPSVNLIYAITPSINARAAYYKTVARPDIRETSGFSYFDFEIMRTIYGGNLLTTSIKNADLRLEWYPAAGEVVSVSGFYKHFDNPIELRMVNTSGRPFYYYENLLKAKDLGIEVDFRKSFSFVGSRDFWKQLFISGNFTWLDASIDFKNDVTTDPETGKETSSKRSRPLAGQSPYVINGGLSYIGKRAGANVTYNRYGRRILYPAVDRSMDEYENPRNMLDLQLSYKPLKNERMELKLNIANLLNQELITYQNLYGPNGKFPGQASIQRYPDDLYKLPEEQLDPKGAAYNPEYDIPVTRRKYGVSFTLQVSYRF